MSESFHSDSEVPAGTFNDGAAIALGLYFTLAVDGTITHARIRTGSALSGTIKWALYRLSDSAQLGEQDITTYTGDAWNTIALTTPIAVAASTRYAAVYWSPNIYTAQGNYFPVSITRGNITAEAVGGRFTEPAADIQIPTSNFNSPCYFVDFVFSASGGATGSTPNGIAVPAAPGSPAAALGLSTAPGGIAVPAAIGAPTAALNRSAVPSGIAVPVILGSPSAASAGAGPIGIHVSAALGSPTATYGLSTAPAGLAVAVHPGSPSSQPPVISGAGHPWLVTTSTSRRLTTQSRPRRITD